jgi:fatty acid desaturase
LGEFCISARATTGRCHENFAIDDPRRNTRTVSAGFLARLLVAPYWVNYHLEHHLFVFVPCWKLRAAHALLLAKGYGPRMEVARSYVDVIRRVTSA